MYHLCLFLHYERGREGRERERERERGRERCRLCPSFIQGYGGFTGFHFSMLMSWLLRSKKINRLMSSYQILRIALQTISTGDWTTQGISMVVEEDGAQVYYMYMTTHHMKYVLRVWLATIMVHGSHD